MGKGDIKTRRGKIFAGSYGNCRPRKRKKWRAPKREESNGVHVSPSIQSKIVEEFKPPTVQHNDLTSNWFEPKAYLHLGDKLTSKDKSWVEKKVSTAKEVAKHNFFPLIHRVVSQRRYKRCADGKKAHYDIGAGRSNEKPRHIFYANHLDSAIYAYYAKVILRNKYEAILSRDKELSACISAYRSIKKNNKKEAGKSNINFAKEAFDYIKTQHSCIALAFDITGFFDNLNHNNLKKAWARLLECDQDRLPDDHYKIFRSLTCFTYIEEPALLKLHGLQGIRSRKKLREKLEKRKSYCNGTSTMEYNRFFRKEIAQKLIVPHSQYEKLVKGKDKGIPQGTPISAFLANLYLLEFDKKVLGKVKSLGGFYRRYSDDIMVVCPVEHEKEVLDYVTCLIASPDFLLEINPDKTEKAYFTNTHSSAGLSADKPIKYLGFEFDGKRVLLKSSALAKYHRRKKSFVKRKLLKTGHMGKFVDSNQKLWTQEIWRKYSLSGTSNFLTYAKRAASIMQESAISNQVRHHKRKLFKFIRKHKSTIKSK